MLAVGGEAQTSLVISMELLGGSKGAKDSSGGGFAQFSGYVSFPHGCQGSSKVYFLGRKVE